MPKEQDRDRNEPWISNYPPLAEWLRNGNAICDWQVRRGRSPNFVMIEGWSLNGYTFIVEVQGGLRGWNVYTSLPSNNITATLADALIRLSKPPSGLPK
jgi:hypothetical protein